MMLCGKQTGTTSSFLTPPSKSQAPHPQHYWALWISLLSLSGACYSQSAAPAYHSAADGTGHRRLIKHPQHHPTNIPQISKDLRKSNNIPWHEALLLKKTFKMIRATFNKPVATK